MSEDRNNKWSLVGIGAVVLVLAVFYGVSAYRESREAQEALSDSPLSIRFFPRVTGRKIVVSSRTIRLQGASGKIYEDIGFSGLPEVHFWWDGKEVLLGSFKYG